MARKLFTLNLTKPRDLVEVAKQEPVTLRYLRNTLIATLSTKTVVFEVLLFPPI